MGWLIPVVLIGGAAAALGRKKAKMGLNTDTTSEPVTFARGYRFTNGCKDLEVLDENKALEWARKLVAGLPASGWEMQLFTQTLGSCTIPLAQDKAASQALAQKHVGFLWKFCLYAIRGAVDSGKLTEAQAAERIQAVIKLASENGIDPAVLTPQTLPP